jgi:hypothetical protein
MGSGSRIRTHVSFDPTRHWFAEVTLFRGRDLGQRERLIMKLLRPHLVAMYGAAKIRHRLAQASKGSTRRRWRR